MTKKQKPTGPTPIDAIKHKDARVNIPTQELRGFVATDEGLFMGDLACHHGRV
jgi:hypothetical protein